jgi:hypothetical protein
MPIMLAGVGNEADAAGRSPAGFPDDRGSSLCLKEQNVRGFTRPATSPVASGSVRVSFVVRSGQVAPLPGTRPQAGDGALILPGSKLQGADCGVRGPEPRLVRETGLPGPAACRASCSY